MPESPLFTDLDESPLFVTRTGELEADLGRLSERVAKFVSGARKYTSHLENAHDVTLQFASSLQEFCGGTDGTDEESMALGGPLLAKFVSTLEELASFQMLLRTQVEMILCERLEQDWGNEYAEARAARRLAERRTLAADTARAKFLARGDSRALGWHGNRSGDRVTEAQEVLELQKDAAEARYDLAWRFTGIAGRRRHEFLTAVVASMDAQVRFFEHSSGTASRLKPYIHQALEVIEHRRSDAAASNASLLALIEQHRVVSTKRLSSALNEAADGDGFGDSVATTAPVGPLQMTAAASSLAVEYEPFIRATRDSGGAEITVLKQGYLKKQGRGFRREWQRRFFVLDSAGLLYYYSAKEARSGGNKSPHTTVDLLTATVKAGAEDTSIPNAFRVVGAGDKGYALQAEDGREAREWTDALQGVISCLLNGAAGVSTPGVLRKPSRPTHSRTRSSDRSGSIGLGSGTTGSGGIREALRLVRGNEHCADCGAPDPDWGSLNLGVLLCITCGGAHRTMGVHISKLRSLTLDTRAWDDGAVALQIALGNDAANLAWEARLRDGLLREGAGGAIHHEEWIWDADSDGDDATTRQNLGGVEGILSNDAVTAATAGGSPRRTDLPPKPNASALAEEKHAYVIAKYHDRAYALSLPDAQGALWDAATKGDVQEAYAALVAGADAKHGYETTAAAGLVAETARRAGHPYGAGSRALSEIGTITVLYAAAKVGDVALAELLIQWGAGLEEQDAFGFTALSVALLHGKNKLAILLLSRGASVNARLSDGRTPYDIAVAASAGSDILHALGVSQSAIDGTRGASGHS